MFNIRTVKATKPTIPSTIPFFKTTVGIVSLVFGCLMVLVAIASVVFWKKRAKKRLVEIPHFSEVHKYAKFSLP